MPTTTGKSTRYSGPLSGLGTDSTSPSLSFLAAYIRAVDTLDQAKVQPSFAQLVSPDAEIKINNGAPQKTSEFLAMFEKRATLLGSFWHSGSDITAWEFVEEGAGGETTVIFESVSM